MRLSLASAFAFGLALALALSSDAGEGRRLVIPEDAEPEELIRLACERDDWASVECRSRLLDAESLAALAACASAESLDFWCHQTDLPQESLLRLAGFGRLRSANLFFPAENARADGLVAALARANPGLAHVRVDGIAASGADVEALAGCPALIHVIVRPDRTVDGAAVARLAEGCPDLAYLRLSQGFWGGTVDQPGWQAISRLRKLDYLWINAPDATGDEIAETLSAGLPALQSLTLYGPRQLTDRGAALLLRRLPRLRLLRLGNAAGLTDATLEAMAGRDMTCVSLNAATGITSAGIRHLAGMENLYDLDVSSSPALDDGDLEWMAASLPGLKQAWLGSQPAMTAEGVARFRARRPEVQLSVDPAAPAGPGAEAYAEPIVPPEPAEMF